MDSYYFLNHILYGFYPLKQTEVLGKLIFNLLPTNILYLKIILGLIGTTILFIFYKIAELYKKNSGWIAIILISSSTVFMNLLFKLEDDIFGMLFVMLSFYFLSKYILSESKKTFDWNIIISILFIGVAGMIWKYAGIFVIAFALISNWNKLYLFFGAGMILVFNKTLILNIIPNFVVAENTPVVGIVLLGILMIGFLKKFRIKKFEIAFWVFLALTFVNMKFSIVLVPIIILNISTNFKKIPHKLQNSILIISSIIFLIVCYSNLTGMPNNQTFELISVGQSYNIDNHTNYEIVADWDYGYYYEFLTKSKVLYFGNPNNGIKNYKNKIIITNSKNVNIINCELIKKVKNTSLVICK
jgi:hypothetical protein